ncbi:MAG: tail fiber domain-containing protein, partial [Bacteroidales bacterium]
ATDNLYLANKTASGRIYLESNTNPIARVGTNDYTIYHSGNLPSFGDLATGKAIGAPQTLGASGTDLNDFKTAGVYVQPGNAGATAGLNYPEALAGSLVVYQAAGIIQEYRTYNTSRMWRRAQYSTGNWSAWSRDYNSLNKPTAADVGALPLSGGTLTGPLAVTGATNNMINLDTSNTLGAYIIGKQAGVNDWYVGRANANKDVALISYSHGGHGLVIRSDRVEASKDIYVGANRVFREDAQIRAAIRKSSIVVANQASVTYYDGNNGWFHNYAEGTELKWGTGNDSAQTVRMALSPAGQLRVSGDFVSGSGVTTTGNMVTNGGGSFLSSGIFRTTRATNPMVEWHKPGVVAYIQYIDSNNNLKIGTSNGAGSEAASVMSISPSQVYIPGKFTSTLNSNRSWTSVGHAAFYNDSGAVMGNGTYHGALSMHSVYAGQYAQETSVGYFCANSNWNDGKIVLQSYNASTGSAARWMFGTNGSLEPSVGGWRLTNGGALTGSAYGGSTIAEWCTRSFAPASDANLKTLLGESKVSALGEVAKMKFHQYVWNDEGFAKDTVKVNRLGVVAQEMEEIDANYVRDIVSYKEDGEKESIKTLDTANLLAVALKAIQELEAKVASLEERLNDLV